MNREAPRSLEFGVSASRQSRSRAETTAIFGWTKMPRRQTIAAFTLTSFPFMKNKFAPLIAGVFRDPAPRPTTRRIALP